CGTGYQSVSLAKNGARYVVGFDANPAYVERARLLAKEMGVAERVTFAERFEEDLSGRFDVVISQNGMEHFKDPADALGKMKTGLRDGGIILVTFGPTWFSPYGSHMHFFCKVPWLNVLFSEATIMNVRRHYIDDGATRFEEVEGGLNKMTVAG